MPYECPKPPTTAARSIMRMVQWLQYCRCRLNRDTGIEVLKYYHPDISRSIQSANTCSISRMDTAVVREEPWWGSLLMSLMFKCDDIKDWGGSAHWAAPCKIATQRKSKTFRKKCQETTFVKSRIFSASDPDMSGRFRTAVQSAHDRNRCWVRMLLRAGD